MKRRHANASDSSLPEEYSDNPMLNILLADRKQAAESIGIRFVVKVESTGLGFIEPVDVTTLFGNLLENAMQAVLKCSGERYIKVHIKNYNEMLSIRIENSVEMEEGHSREVRIKNGEDGAEVTGSGFECQKGLDWGISVLQSFQLHGSFFGLFPVFRGKNLYVGHYE